MRKKCQDCLEYEKKIEKLEEDLAYVKFELEQLRAKRYKSKRKLSKDGESRPEPKKKVRIPVGFTTHSVFDLPVIPFFFYH